MKKLENIYVWRRIRQVMSKNFFHQTIFSKTYLEEKKKLSEIEQGQKISQSPEGY